MKDARRILPVWLRQIAENVICRFCVYLNPILAHTMGSGKYLPFPIHYAKARKRKFAAEAARAAQRVGEEYSLPNWNTHISQETEERSAKMEQLSEKELNGLNELLNEEELLVKKFKMLASHSQDAEVKSKFTEIANRHQEHFMSLYSQLR